MVAVFSCGHSGRDCFWAVIRSFEVELWTTTGGRSSRSARVPLYGAPWPGGRISADKRFSTGTIHESWFVS